MRYKLQLPVIFRWNDGAEQTEGGFTSDVAVDGALILKSRDAPQSERTSESRFSCRRRTRRRRKSGSNVREK